MFTTPVIRIFLSVSSCSAMVMFPVVSHSDRRFGRANARACLSVFGILFAVLGQK
jgi:hypothetical protein